MQPKTLPNLLVLFTRSIDDVGHPAGHAALHHFDLLLGELERAVRKLRSWGYAEVDVVTDHGFVLLHKDLDVQPFEVDKTSLAYVHPRWALTQPGTQAPAAAVPFPLDPDWQIVLPPGLRSFGAPGTFFHGGATLQEAVVPHLHFEWAARRQRMHVTALVPQVEVYALAVKVMLVPEQPPAEDLLEGTPEPIRVRVFLGAPDAPCSNEKDRGNQQRGDRSDQRHAVSEPGTGHRAGDGDTGSGDGCGHQGRVRERIVRAGGEGFVVGEGRPCPVPPAHGVPEGRGPPTSPPK